MNTYFALPCLLAFAAVTTAVPPATLAYVPVATVDSIPNPNYGFHYAVNDPSTGDNKGQWETRDGDVVRGAYSLVEPDGNVRVVEYVADSLHGFNAVVKRTSPNIHSVAKPIVEPLAAPLAPITPLWTKVIADPVAEAPLDFAHYAPIAHEPIIAAPPAWDILPASVSGPEPWMHLSGTTYGGKGHIVRHWAAGPISMDGKTLTIRTKHH